MTDLQTQYIYRITGSGPKKYRSRNGFKPRLQLSAADIKTVIRLFFGLPFKKLPDDFFALKGGAAQLQRGIKPYLERIRDGKKILKVYSMSDPTRIRNEIEIKASELKPEDFFEYIRAQKSGDTSHISFDTALSCGDLAGNYKFRVDISDLKSYEVTMKRLGGTLYCPGLKAVQLRCYRKFRLCMDHELLQNANVIGLDVEISNTHRDIYFFTEIGKERISDSRASGSTEWIPFNKQGRTPPFGTKPPRPSVPHPRRLKT